MKTQTEIYVKYGIYPKKQKEALKIDKTLKPQKERVHGNLQLVYTPQEESQLLWALGFFIHYLNGKKYLCEIRRELK